jgi:hypothetical protein
MQHASEDKNKENGPEFVLADFTGFGHCTFEGKELRLPNQAGERSQT